LIFEKSAFGLDYRYFETILKLVNLDELKLGLISNFNTKTRLVS